MIRDIKWTDSDQILEQFIKNHDSKKWQRQYVATHAGITRIFPGLVQKKKLFHNDNIF